MIVVDSNVLSELMHAVPAPMVLDWSRQQPRAALLTTAVTQAEIHFGIELLPLGKRREALESAAERLFLREFAGRILPFDSAAAVIFSAIAAGRRKIGRPMSLPDAQIAAIARVHGAAVATRNVSDFTDCGVTVIDPWAA